MGWNPITNLDPDIFDGLTNLEEIYVGNTAITSLDPDIFDGLTNLEVLHLSDNRLSSLPAGIFDDLSGLGKLEINCDFLTELDLSLFDPFAATLYELNIAGNNFTTPPTETAIRAKLTRLRNLETELDEYTSCRHIPSVTVRPRSLTVNEGNSATYSVVLYTPPSRNVTVDISSNNTSVTVSPASLTFTPQTWNTAQTVTVSSAHDADSDDDSTSLVHDPSGAEYESVLNATSTVSITDDDVPAVTVGFGAASYTAAEDGDVEVTVELSADPERSVTVPLTATDQGGATGADYSGVPASVTFNSGDTARASKTFTVGFSATADLATEDGDVER